MTDQSASYDVIKRCLGDGALVARLQQNPESTLRQEGVPEHEIPAVLQILVLMQVGAAQQQAVAAKYEAQLDSTLAVATEMKEGLKNTLEQIDAAFKSTMRMYEVSFYLGVGLVIAAVVGAFVGADPLLPAVFGALGILDVLAFFLVKPQEGLQSSRANLAQIQAAMYNWFMDSVNLNTLMSSLHQQGLNKDVLEISVRLLDHTDRTLEMLQKYCKLASR